MKNKNLIFRGIILPLALAFIICAFSAPVLLHAGETPGILDGKSYTGKTGEIGKKTSEDEEIVFRDGKLHSVGCEQWGFNDGDYKAVRSGEGDKIEFLAETTSPKHGKIVWKGTTQGDSIDVTYTWTKKGWLSTKTKNKWFKGSLKK